LLLETALLYRHLFAKIILLLFDKQLKDRKLVLLQTHLGLD